jgi:hypothetical protein
MPLSLFTIFHTCCILNFMNSPPRQAVEQVFEQDRQDYWAIREKLLAKYSGKWVAVHKRRVVAVGDDPLSIMEQALAEDGYAYTNKLGEEDKIVIRQRRVSFADARLGEINFPLLPRASREACLDIL